MIPDNVEKIIMTKEDYDRNVEQLLYDKINAEQEIERLNNIIKEVIKLIEADYFEDGSGENIEKVLEILKGSDKE